MVAESASCASLHCVDRLRCDKSDARLRTDCHMGSVISWMLAPGFVWVVISIIIIGVIGVLCCRDHSCWRVVVVKANTLRFSITNHWYWHDHHFHGTVRLRGRQWW